jgi:hypothetical protein
MPWKIVFRKDEQPTIQCELQSRQAAVTVACLLIEQGIRIERIEGPDRQQLDLEAIRQLGAVL